MTKQSAGNRCHKQSRIRRIKGCGRTGKDVNDLYERFLQTRTMMGQLGQSGMMQQMMQGQPFGAVASIWRMPGMEALEWVLQDKIQNLGFSTTQCTR